MNRYVLNLMIVLLSIVNSSFGMERFARLLSCMSPQYSEVDPENRKKKSIEIPVEKEETYQISLSTNPKVTIVRLIDQNTQNRWSARLVEEIDRIVELKMEEKFLDNVLFSQHFEVSGKKTGVITLKLLEISKDNKTIKTDRITIGISQ